jgi:hypothetical protein
MENVSGEGSFQIILQSEDVEDSSDYWQDQCRRIYNDLYRDLPKGTIRPLTLEGPAEGKAIDINSFSHLIIDDFTAKIISSLFVESLLVVFEKWFRHERNATLILKYPDGNTVKVSKKFLLELLKYSQENPKLSIFSVLNNLKDFKE